MCNLNAAIPTAGVVNLDAIPLSLKSLPQWCLWRYETRGAKPTKVPYRATGNGRCSTTDPTTWSTFDAAAEAYRRSPGRWSGIGFVFKAGGGIVGIDLDNSVNSQGDLLPWALEVFGEIGAAQTYGEVSPSLRGVKLLMWGSLPVGGAGKNRKGFGPEGSGGVEIYEKGRFFAITGLRMTCCAEELGRADEGLDKLYERLCEPALIGRDHAPRLGSADERTERCWRYIRNCPDAISGQNGHDKALRAACETVRFDLDRSAATEVMRRYSVTKSGGEPWTEREISHKLDSAERLAAGERGSRLVNSLVRSPQKERDGEVRGDADSSEDLHPLPLGSLWDSDPDLREPIIDGLLRRGQVGNLISTSKSYKTYLVLNLAISTALGRRWLDRFQITPGKVLVVDLELQRPDITRRTRDIAEAMHADLDVVNRDVLVLPLRGRGITIAQLEPLLLRTSPRTYSLVIIDPLYKTYPAEFDENSNPQMTNLYRRFERLAEHLDAAVLVVHHATKGSQAEKNVVDVGAGAGAQARAPDAHMVIRPHQEDGAVVFDCRVRSFCPVEPMVLTWNYPLWQRDFALNPEDLRTGRKAKNTEKSQPQPTAAKPIWTPETFSASFVVEVPQAKDVILSRASRAEGLSAHKARGLLAEAEAEKRIFRHSFAGDNKVYFSTREQSVVEAGMMSVCVSDIPPHPPVGGQPATGGGATGTQMRPKAPRKK